MQLERGSIRRVFVRAPNWLGDVVMATPAFARIRSFFIDAEIVCGLKKGHAAVLAGSKSFDRYLPVEKPRGLRGVWRQARVLRAERFDLAILFPNSASSALVCLLAGIPRRLGYARGRRLLLTHPVRVAGPRRPLARLWQRHGPRRPSVPMVDYWFAMLDAFGMPRVGPQPILRVTPDEEVRCAELLARYAVGDGDRLVLISPGASFGPSKLWSTERWVELGRRLVAELDPRTALLVLCGPGEEELASAVAAGIGAPRVRATLPTVPLDVLKPLVRRASLLLTPDSGPRHVATAFDVPTVVLMGPTDPGYTSRNLERTTIVRHDVECGPCHLPVCPLDHRCMTLITVDEVLAAARRWL